MTTVRMQARWVWALMILFTIAFNIYDLATPGFTFLKAALGFIWLFLLPGWMIARALHVRATTFWEQLTYVVGLGIFGIMVAGLLVDVILPQFGNPHPLGTFSLLLSLDVGWLGLFAVTVWRHRGLRLKMRIPRLTNHDIAVISMGVPMLLATIAGAISINNNGTNLITWGTLVFSAGYLAYLVNKREQLSETAILAGVYWVGLCLLLMTSLRGWYITGHDVQNEFYVFSIALAHLNWNIANYHDAYNACLSITLLPTIINQIMGIDAIYVFKTVFQVFFALVPVVTYIIARRFNTRLVSLLAAIYFIAFPTFFSDMPMLNRQEVAFLFMGLILLTIFNQAWSVARRRWLIVLLGIAVILSHYATTYVMIGIFAVVLGIRVVADLYNGTIKKWWRKRRRTPIKWQWHRQTGTISVLVIGMLLAFSYIWSVTFTNTGGNVASLLVQTVNSLEHGSTNTKSSDTSYSLFGGKGLTPQQSLDSYVATTVPTLRSDLPADELYAPKDFMKYPIQIVPPVSAPLTPVGSFLNHLGFPVQLFNALTRQGSAIFLQLALIIGIATLFISKRLKREQVDDYRYFQLGAIVLVVAVVVLPVLSAQYGVLRAFQQALMIAGASIVLVTMLVIPARFAKARVIVPATLAIGLFVSSTGIITTALGGYPNQLQLANSGLYYDLYYSHTSEVIAANWLQSAVHNEPGVTQINTTLSGTGYVFHTLNQTPSVSVTNEGIYPGLLLKNGYVFVGYTATVNDRANIYVNGNLFTYKYPTEFLNDNKNLLYTNGQTRIYK
jgi:uncharacterized membrane protein